MRTAALKWSGIAGAALVVAAVAFSSTWKSGEEGSEASHERMVAYARARLGGAALASLAKGGDPDGRSVMDDVKDDRGRQHEPGDPVPLHP